MLITAKKTDTKNVIILFDAESMEYIVRTTDKAGMYKPENDYYTDDLKDAQTTMNMILKQLEK